uniref:Histone deacetylase complex subunit SAP30 Sin3 binding domain-containing protein n=1 Tax=Polytomella parva TaxID=51329 RepID=A0A7S0UQQ4_9CHLO|mmetsp:Transcript_13027/g.23167  ORF Transcript_13027/g.23167 Transcript_13027/m.23167 type:complete len:152 (+) Transcript_13027:28-483(+)
MDKRRPVRNSALKAQQSFATNGGPHASSDDDEAEARPATRTSRQNRSARVDFYKLDLSSLLRYKKYYKLGDATTASKEEMVPMIQKHFAQQNIDEEETLLRFIQAVQKHNRQQQQSQFQNIAPPILKPNASIIKKTVVTKTTTVAAYKNRR